MSELFPARNVAIQVVSCTDSSKVRLFNRWMDQRHVPDLRTMPGVVDVYRYLDVEPDLGEMAVGRFAPQPGRPTRYLNLLRIDSDDPWSVMQGLRDWEETQRVGGKLPEYYQSYEMSVWDFVAFRQSVLNPCQGGTRLPDGMPELVLLVFAGADATRQREHNDWWLYTHAHDLLETPGMTQCARYRNMSPQLADDDPLFMHVYEFDTNDPSGALLKILTDDEKVRKPQGRFSPFNKPCKPHASGLYRHWDPMVGRWS